MAASSSSMAKSCAESRIDPQFNFFTPVRADGAIHRCRRETSQPSLLGYLACSHLPEISGKISFVVTPFLSSKAPVKHGAQ